MRFNVWLKESREARGMSQRGLAKDLNLSDSTIKNYESGYSVPDEGTLEKLAKMFNARFIDLWISCNEKSHRRVVEMLEKGASEQSWSDETTDVEMEELCEILQEHPKLKTAILLMAKSLLEKEKRENGKGGI